MSGEADEQPVPHEDIDYAVENALWVADATRTTGTPRRSFMEVFEAQLQTHWRELLVVHQSGEEPEPATDSGSEQTGLAGWSA